MPSIVLRKFRFVRISIMKLTRQASDGWNGNFIDWFCRFLNHDTSNIPNLSSMNVNLGLESQTKCDDMFSDPGLYHVFSHSLVRYLVYIFFFSYVVFIDLLRIEEVVGIYCQFIPD